LGSGKTTAIIQAARALMRRGLRVGVVTNDQGKYLVDTAFVRMTDIPAVEVTGGCFCCNYADLDKSLDQLSAQRPDVIFAESVGSCADLVATVVKPLLQLKAGQAAPRSFSVFTDARLLRRRLRGDPMPFSEDVVYIYDQQIEEAGLVVVNKIDLLSAEARAEIAALMAQRWAGKPWLAQSSLSEEGVEPWLARVEGGDVLPQRSLEIDYQRYGRGEAQLAWLDEEVRLEAGAGAAADAVRALIGGTLAALREKGAAVGHLKFLLQTEGFEDKFSFTSLEETDWEERLPQELAGAPRLLVNARVEMPAEDLRALFLGVLNACGSAYHESGVSFFHPAQPNPTHRIR
jgi:Ni2+-binding GTPase involved in maturation of urease and hydrogenase